jgi:hypothetical protein
VFFPYDGAFSGRFFPLAYVAEWVLVVGREADVCAEGQREHRGDHRRSAGQREGLY